MLDGLVDTEPMASAASLTGGDPEAQLASRCGRRAGPGRAPVARGRCPRREIAVAALGGSPEARALRSAVRVGHQRNIFQRH